MKAILFLFTLHLLFAYPCLAHEGHAVPGSIPSIHGGMALAGKEINLEYVINGDKLILYPISHEGKDLTAAQVKLSGTTKAPKEKSEKLNLQYKDGGFSVQLDFKKAYRLEVNISAESNNKKDIFKFQMEK